MYNIYSNIMITEILILFHRRVLMIIIYFILRQCFFDSFYEVGRLAEITNFKFTSNYTK